MERRARLGVVYSWNCQFAEKTATKKKSKHTADTKRRRSVLSEHLQQHNEMCLFAHNVQTIVREGAAVRGYVSLFKWKGGEGNTPSKIWHTILYKLVNVVASGNEIVESQIVGIVQALRQVFILRAVLDLETYIMPTLHKKLN